MMGTKFKLMDLIFLLQSLINSEKNSIKDSIFLKIGSVRYTKVLKLLYNLCFILIKIRSDYFYNYKIKLNFELLNKKIYYLINHWSLNS